MLAKGEGLDTQVHTYPLTFILKANQAQNNERAITAIKHYDQTMQSFDAEFHWSLLVKSYHLSDTSIYHC